MGSNMGSSDGVLTETRRRLVSQHSETTSWPSVRNDPKAAADGYIHYCSVCHTERQYPCNILRAAAAIEGEAVTAERARIRGALESDVMWEGTTQSDFAAILDIVAGDA